MCAETIELAVFSERSRETGQNLILNICYNHFQPDSPKKNFPSRIREIKFIGIGRVVWFLPFPTGIRSRPDRENYNSLLKIILVG